MEMDGVVILVVDPRAQGMAVMVGLVEGSKKLVSPTGSIEGPQHLEVQAELKYFPLLAD